jgi:WD40 repeat protein
VLATLQKEYERLYAISQKDSLERVNFLQLVQQEEQTEQANQILSEVTKRSELLEKTAEQIQQEKALAEQQVKLAREGLSQAEIDKMVELRKRMQILSQTVALKSTQVDEAQLAGLLAYQAYSLNKENGGQINHPDIYHSLYVSLSKLKGQKFNTLKGHKGPVDALVFDPARNIMYSADNTGVVNKWTFRKENPVPTSLIANEDANTCLAITIDGRWIACGSEDRTVQLINALQPTQAPRIFDAHEGSVSHVCFSPGRNAMVSVGADNRVKYWDLLINESSLILQEVSGINDIDVSPSGQSIACVASNGRLVEWNISGKKSQILFNHSSPIMSVTYDLEGERIALGDRNGKILIINAQSGKLLKVLNGHTSRILDLKFSPDNRLLASSGLDGVIRLWNATDWNDYPIEIKEQESWVESLAFSPDGRNLYSSSNNDNLIYIWPVKVQYIVDEICGLLKRQLTQQEWNMYIGNDVSYKEACK